MLALPTLLIAGVAHATTVPPLVATLDWSPRASRLRVHGGPGEHLSEDGPATVRIAWGQQSVVRETQGKRLSGDGVVLPPLAGEVSLTVAAVSCEDGGARCVPVETSFAVTLDARRGTVQPLALDPESIPGSEVQGDAPTPQHAPTADAAFDAARLSDRLVLLDFTAHWCPPCNLMAAEVLDDPADQDALSDFVVAKVDVDRAESWRLKDRYDVGGYPTLLAARPDGTELDRLVGYPGEEALLAWLDGLTELPALGDLPALDTLEPATLARLAVRLQRAGRDDEAGAALAAARQSGAPTDAAAVAVEGDPAAAVRLLQGTRQPGAWLGDVFTVARAEDTVRLAFLERLPAWLEGADPVEKADLLYFRGVLDAEQGPRWFAQAAATLWLGLSGDPTLDRGHWVGLASLYEGAEDTQSALAVLDNAVEHFPTEFTFHHARARTLFRADRGAEAVDAARSALEHAFGDNRLRAANTLALALEASGDRTAAKALVDQTLADAPRPAPGTRVRTFRYLTALEETQAALEGQPPTAP